MVPAQQRFGRDQTPLASSRLAVVERQLMAADRAAQTGLDRHVTREAGVHRLAENN